jgi:hypothetical protein
MLLDESLVDFITKKAKRQSQFVIATYKAGKQSPDFSEEIPR